MLLRDDKSFPYILITGDHVSPQLTKHRGARNRPGDYFGPFASVWAVNRTLNALQRAFLLRSCTDSYYENRTRPCLLHQIKRCAGPCTGEVGHVEYARLVAQARDSCAAAARGVKKALADEEMQKASDALEFERAARYRDRLAALSAIQATQDINPQSVEEADVFALHEEAGQFCIQVFFFRNFQNWGNRAYSRADRTTPAQEVLGAFVAQFYDDKPAPRLVLLSHDVEETDLLAEALGTRSPHRVEVATPRRGEKRDLVQHAAQRTPRGAGAPPRRHVLPSRSCWRRWARPSASRARSAGSRSTTTPTSWARTRSAAWWWLARKASRSRTTAPSTSSRPSSPPATTTG